MSKPAKASTAARPGPPPARNAAAAAGDATGAFADEAELRALLKAFYAKHDAKKVRC